jgi:glycosyltransferase involved in cell wall biosynthesis
VTPSYNQGSYLQETIRSILLQGYPNLEYFIMDGGSSDQSVEVIRRYANWIDGWVSEADAGQADAINKGLARATGDVFQWINSDDVLAPGACRAVGEAWTEGVTIAGSVLEFDDAHAYLVENRRITVHNLLHHFYRNAKASYHQPGVWLDRHKIKELGGFENDLHYCFDYYTSALYFERWPQIRYIADTLVSFRIHAQQKTTGGRDKATLEFGRARERLTTTLLSKRLRHEARIGMRRWNWPAEVARIRTSVDQPLARVAILGWKFIRHPRVAMNRLTLGAIRREVAGRAKLKSTPVSE